MFPVTDHFDLSEFGCHDGTPYPVGLVDAEDPAGRTWYESRLKPLCDVLEVIRASAGNQRITIDSGYRSEVYDDRLYRAHVAAVGDDGDVAPASRSQHPKGRAADITHATLRPVALFNLIMALYASGRLPALGGVGLYPTFVHVDCRPRSTITNHLAIWGGTRPSNIA